MVRRRFTRDLFQPGSHVHGGADAGEVKPVAAADIAEQDLPDMQRKAEAKSLHGTKFGVLYCVESPSCSGSESSLAAEAPAVGASIVYSTAVSYHVHPNETVREAIDILREYAVSQMPVVRAEPPVMAAEVMGSVVERDLLDALFDGRARLSDPLERHMSAALPMVGAGEPVNAAVAALHDADAAIVLDDGRPVGVVTRQDLLGFLASR